MPNIHKMRCNSGKMVKQVRNFQVVQISSTNRTSSQNECKAAKIKGICVCVLIFTQYSFGRKGISIWED